MQMYLSFHKLHWYIFALFINAKMYIHLKTLKTLKTKQLNVLMTSSNLIFKKKKNYNKLIYSYLGGTNDALIISPAY